VLGQNEAAAMRKAKGLPTEARLRHSSTPSEIERTTSSKGRGKSKIPGVKNQTKQYYTTVREGKFYVQDIVEVNNLVKGGVVTTGFGEEKERNNVRCSGPKYLRREAQPLLVSKDKKS